MGELPQSGKAIRQMNWSTADTMSKKGISQKKKPKEKAPQVVKLAGLCHHFWRRRRPP
jgi:hypothetical protein